MLTSTIQINTRFWDKVLKLFLMINPTNDIRNQERIHIFNKILSEYDGLVSRICFGYSQTREEFEDLRQDVYVNIWQGLRSYHGDSGIKTWIYRVAINTCVSTLRKRSSRIKTANQITVFSEIIDEDAEKMALLNDLRESINQLSQLDRAIMLLWLEENTYEEISEIVGISRHNVAVRLHRSKQLLKSIFGSMK